MSTPYVEQYKRLMRDECLPNPALGVWPSSEPFVAGVLLPCNELAVSFAPPAQALPQQPQPRAHQPQCPRAGPGAAQPGACSGLACGAQPGQQLQQQQAQQPVRELQQPGTPVTVRVCGA